MSMLNPSVPWRMLNPGVPCPCGSGKEYRKCCLGKNAVIQGISNRWVASQPYQPAKYEITVKAGSELPSDPLLYYSNQGDTLHAQGNLDAAIENYRKALLIKPDFVDVLCALGFVLQRQGKLDEAAENYRKALSFRPDYAGAYNNLGLVLEAQGNLNVATDNYRKAIAIRPDYADAHFNLGNVLKKQGKLDEAIASYRDALKFNPGDSEACYNMGNTFQELGKPDDAVSYYQKAISLRPDYADAHGNLGNLLHAIGRADEAIVSYRRVIELKPSIAEAYNNLGNPFHSQGKLHEAAINFAKAIELKPDFAEAYNNLGNVLLDQGKVDAAIENYHKALALKPDYVLAYDNLLMAIAHHSGSSPAEYLAEVRRYGDTVGVQAKPYTQWTVSSDDQNERPLRVGLVSGDLRAHPVGFFLENILAHLDPGRLELVAYVTNPREDLITARIKSRFTAWNLIAGLSDEAAARKIHLDGIHILIDMAGHTAHNRLPIFTWKPAPVQVSWLGYWASTGVPGMDYLLADRVSVPESHQAQFTETIWYLPDTRFCFTPPADSTKIPLSPLPRMRNGYITFGCFQKLGKINEGVLALWGKVFQALPDARLRLQNKQMNCPVAREQIRSQLANFGITPERVTIEKDVHREDYLAAHADVDIILDTFPFPGGTTTCEALWMGVPTLTLAGDTLVGRQGVSMLACAGLEDWIASDEDDFVARAVAHAADINQLAQLRAELRQKVLGSPLFDGIRFALQLENALQNMWQQKILPDSSLT